MTGVRGAAMQALTGSQGRVLDFVRKFLAEKGFPPTHAEIAEGLGFRSANAAKEHLLLMAKKGAVALTPGVSRGLKLLVPAKEGRGRRDAPTPAAAPPLRDAGSGSRGLPLIGQVAAGQPVLAIENVERTVPLDPAFFRP